MEGGRIDSQGSLEDLRRRGILDEITQEAAEDDTPATPEPAEPTIEADFLDDAEIKVAKEAKQPRKLVEEEHRETGSVKWSVYKAYLAAAGYWVLGLFLFFVLVMQSNYVAEKIWIKIWGEAYENTANASTVSAYSSFDAATHGTRYTGNTGLLSSNWPSALERPLYYGNKAVLTPLCIDCLC
jgi:hypothetical protein